MNKNEHSTASFEDSNHSEYNPYNSEYVQIISDAAALGLAYFIQRRDMHMLTAENCLLSALAKKRNGNDDSSPAIYRPVEIFNPIRVEFPDALRREIGTIGG